MATRCKRLVLELAMPVQRFGGSYVGTPVQRFREHPQVRTRLARLIETFDRAAERTPCSGAGVPPRASRVSVALVE